MEQTLPAEGAPGEYHREVLVVFPGPQPVPVLLHLPPVLEDQGAPQLTEVRPEALVYLSVQPMVQ
jgi:hypothetical protein